MQIVDLRYKVRAITLDLDDTLWPIWPAIERAERALHGWLLEHAPTTARRHDPAALRALRDEVARQQPQWSHDLSAIRRESLRLALLNSGDDPALAEPAFELFFEHRQRVELFEDAEPALRRLAARFPLLALTNGNADLQRIGLAPYFGGVLSAREFGVGKPDARIFQEACRRLGHDSVAVLHVGDDPLLDVSAAHEAGHPTAWVCRDPMPEADAPSATIVVRDLRALADWLEA